MGNPRKKLTTDIQARQAQIEPKPYKLSVDGGLYLHVMPNGSKYWRYKYRIDGKEKLLALGVYPDVSLAAAKEKHRNARIQLKSEAIDPSAQKKATKEERKLNALNTMEAVGREWLSKHGAKWSESNRKKIIARLENDVFPWLGNKPIADIKAPEILRVLNRIEERGALDSAHRVRQTCGQIFRYAIATGRMENDPTAALRGALPSPPDGNFAAITEPSKVGDLMRALHSYQGTLVTRCALKLAPLVFVRPNELRQARWTDIDFENALWSFEASKTKQQHIVPLCSQAVEIFRELQPLTGRGIYVFPSAHGKGKPMSENAVLQALRRLDFAKGEMTGHGFRAMARTILDEVLNFPAHLIEHQLAHAVKDANGTSYNRTAHLSQRKQMMQTWADYLDKLRSE